MVGLCSVQSTLYTLKSRYKSWMSGLTEWMDFEFIYYIEYIADVILFNKIWIVILN
jgi:hypothetical protein